MIEVYSAEKQVREQREGKAAPRILARIESLKLLSKIESTGLLSLAEKQGLTLSGEGARRRHASKQAGAVIGSPM